MAATRIVEEERGTFTGAARGLHQGYWAGDFSARRTSANGPTSPGQLIQDDAA